ncbi:MAG: peptidoglycan-binding protein [Patescibacteria group bacterium]
MHAASVPVVGFNNQPSQTSDTAVTIDVHINDTESDPSSISIRYSLDGGNIWHDAMHLSGASFPISGNSVTGITTYGDGPNNRSNVAFHWDFSAEPGIASSTETEIEVTPHDASGDGEPIVSDPFMLTAPTPPASPPVFAEDSGAVTDITQTSVIVHYDMSSEGSAPLSHFELDYASDAYYLAHASYAEHTPITFSGAFADSGATNVTGLSCGAMYHFAQTFTNGDGQSATSTDATFTTSPCDGGGDGGGTPFTEGDGSSNTPFIVDDCTQIPTINDDLSAAYLLDANLDCREMGTDVMIGGFGMNPFTGTFDGGGHSIAIDIENAGQPGMGLFRSLYGATVHDLAIAPDSIVLGQDVDGSIAGFAYNSTLTRVGSAAFVVSAATTPQFPLAGTGGLVGALFSSQIYGSEFTGIAASPFIVGGIAGLVMNDLSDGPPSLISRSDSVGGIYSGLSAGGVAGYLDGGSQIRNSYSSSTVQFNDEFAGSDPQTGGFGGLVGVMASGIISRSYAAGSVAAGPDSVFFPSGGLVGFMESPDARIVHSFAAPNITTDGAPVGGFVGGVNESETPLTGLYDDYFDTLRTEETVCVSGDTSARADCTGVDGSASGYWLNTHDTPIAAWNISEVWDVSGEHDGFPLLLGYAGPETEESDARDSGEDSVSEDIPLPSHHSGSAPSKRSVLSRLDTYLKNGDSKGLAEYVQRNQGRLDQYVEQGQALPPEVASLLSIGPAAAPVVVVTYPLRNLQKGMAGGDVSALQTLLIKEAAGSAASVLAQTGATGYFGPLTQAALAEYQKAHGIVPSAGYFGPLTQALMKAAGLTGLWW